MVLRERGLDRYIERLVDTNKVMFSQCLDVSFRSG